MYKYVYTEDHMQIVWMWPALWAKALDLVQTMIPECRLGCHSMSIAVLRTAPSQHKRNLRYVDWGGGGACTQTK